MNNIRSLLMPRHINEIIYPASHFSRRFLRFVPPLKSKTQGSTKRCDITIIGAPNVGKSVLLNCLVGTHVAAANRKAHTTRRQILGVFNFKTTQLAFYDTPGFIPSINARKKEQIGLRQEMEAAVAETDIVLLVVDAARRLTEKYDFEFVEMTKLAFAGAKKEVILVLNKVDLVEPKDLLLDVVEKYVSLINGVKYKPEEAHLAQLDTTTFMISALTDDGVIDLKNYLLASASFKPWILPKEKGSTNMTDEELVQEIVYEKLLENVHDEIPHRAIIECTNISDLTPTRIQLNVSIKVENSRQVKIIVGHQGRGLLKIRQAASRLLQAMLHKDIILELSIEAGDDSNDGGKDDN